MQKTSWLKTLIATVVYLNIRNKKQNPARVRKETVEVKLLKLKEMMEVDN